MADGTVAGAVLYLSGHTSEESEPELIARAFGIMAQPGTYHRDRLLRYPFWAADNACYAARWQEEKWLRWLDRLPRDRCLFAVAPDVYPDAAATLERSSNYFALIRDMGFPVALVAQDGAERLDLPWDDFDCLFIGGEKRIPSRLEWKLGPEAEHLVRDARRRGLWCHMGRVNSLTRMERARAMGCHSADGTFIGKGPRVNLPRANHWMRWLRAHPPLPLDVLEGAALPVHRDAALFMESLPLIPEVS